MCVLTMRDIVRITAGGKTRYQHCLGNCLIAKACKFTGLSAMAASLAKEFSDFWKCIVSGKQGNCDSFWQEEDFQDNRRGRKCPPARRCSDQCAPLLNAPEPAPGPLGWWTSGGS
jgi:hypothetical protein